MFFSVIPMIINSFSPVSPVSPVNSFSSFSPFSPVLQLAKDAIPPPWDCLDEIIEFLLDNHFERVDCEIMEARFARLCTKLPGFVTDDFFEHTIRWMGTNTM